MDTCFLFTKEINEQGCFCLKLNNEGELIAPPVFRHFPEIHTLQKNSITLIVESSLHASCLDLELPWLPERKARAAIPFALEDQVAQPLDELHFAFDKLRHTNNRYTVVVMSQHRIRYLIDLLKHHDILFECITLDWFALQPEELCVTDACLLVHTHEFKGALSHELFELYFAKHENGEPFLFQDSLPISLQSTHKQDKKAAVWLAERLRRSKPLNLCQGAIQQHQSTDWITKGYQWSVVLFGLWLVSILFVNAVAFYLLHQKTKRVDHDIAAIYHQFFPDAKQVISPKFRISQLIGNNSSKNQNHFWYLLNQLAGALKNNPLSIEQIRYQNQSITVTLVCSDFLTLEHLENHLKRLQLNVKRTQASTQDQQVLATLELS